jgi:hypothetical protein
MSPLRKQSGVGGANTANNSQAIEILEGLVTQLGLAGVVGLLAEIASQRSEVFLLSGDDLKAAVWIHDAKTLDRAARALDGD